MPKKSEFKSWGVKKIKSILPHRKPFIFLDKVIYAKKDKCVIAIKNVKKNEYFLKGHFPNMPIMPGVLIIESMAQAAIILFHITKPHITKKHPLYYLAKSNIEFLSLVYPNNKMVIEAMAVKIFDDGEMVNASVKVNNKIVAKANLTMIVKNK